MVSAALIREPWSVEAAAGLAAALGEAAPLVAAEVQAGAADLYRVEGRGWMVWRREGSELVCIAAQGRDLLPVFAEICRADPAESIRIHSARPGMGRFLAPLGFREAERVYRLRK